VIGYDGVEATKFDQIVGITPIQSPQGCTLVFGPDGKLYSARITNAEGRQYVSVDGKPVLNTDLGLPPGVDQPWWDIFPEGTLNILAQDDNSLKRTSITHSPSTSLDTFLAERSKAWLPRHPERGAF
jgi:hypothetical protein